MVYNTACPPLQPLFWLTEYIVGKIVKHFLVKLEGITVVVDLIDRIQRTNGIALLQTGDGVFYVSQVLSHCLLREQDCVLPIQTDKGILGFAERIHEDLPVFFRIFQSCAGFIDLLDPLVYFFTKRRRFYRHLI